MPSGCGPILICYDGSARASRSMGVAAGLLTKRTAVVVDIGPVWAEAEVYALAPGVRPETLYRQDFDRAYECAIAGAKIACKAGFEAEPRAMLAAPTWRGIVAVADEIDASVIVIGSRGLKGVRKRLEGSLSHQLARHASCPVLVIPPGHP